MIERLRPEDWERSRTIRLRALRDAPDAFGSTLAGEQDREQSFWEERLARPDAAHFVAVEGGEDVGLAVGSSFHGRDGAAGLFSMWVAPPHRGRGLAGQLVTAVADWARRRGYSRLLLDVADDNAAAIRAYARQGFVPTGVTGTLPAPRDHILEHERALEL